MEEVDRLIGVLRGRVFGAVLGSQKKFRPTMHGGQPRAAVAP